MSTLIPSYGSDLTAEFLMAYLATQSQLSKIAARFEEASEPERNLSRRRLQNARKRCNLLKRLVYYQAQ